MLPVLIAMFSGMAAGYLFRRHRGIFSFLDPATAWVIRLLFFLLGFGIGGDGNLMDQVPVLGLQGLVLALSAIIGSVLSARILLGGSSEFFSGIHSEDQSGRAKEVISSEIIEGAGSTQWKTLRGSVFAVAAFFLGVAAGVWLPGMPQPAFDPAGAVLYLLMFMVGMGAGADPTAFIIIRKHGFRLALLPLAVVIGTLAGVLAAALLWPALPIRESLAVGAGFGYYSLSSLLIRELAGGDWAAVALLSNIAREILTLLTAPRLVKMGGPSAPAAAGGATSMDTTLAATVQYSGRIWTVPALFSGVVLTLLTPFAVTLILTL